MLNLLSATELDSDEAAAALLACLDV